MDDAAAVNSADHWIATGGGRLFARSWDGAAGGGGAPLVLLHDSLGSVALWRGFPERLARALGRRVVAYDRLGFGQSDPRTGRLPLGFIRDEAAQGVWPVCDQLGIGTAVLVGHSVGGAMAMEAAAQRPGSCQAVVTLAAQAFVEDRTLAGLRDAERSFRDPAQMERLARYHGAKAGWVLDAWIGTWLAPEFAGWTLDAALAEVRCPVLAMHGDRDEYGSVEHPARISGRSAGPAEMRILEECGHVPHREQPDAACREIARFLKERAIG